ncbi:MAG: hypothetical protein IJH04_05095 [Eggerthellaceae bacterium]|nr:hypothetical protein [Eggerthellaceae bacterium]
MRSIFIEEARRQNLALGLNPDGTCLGDIAKPFAWCRTITTSSGRSDPFCQDILAVLVRMASARLVDGSPFGGWYGETCCDEEGFFLISYTRLADKFNTYAKRVKRAVVKLEQLGVIERRVRIDDIPSDSGTVRGQNSLYIRIVPEGLAALSEDGGH